jgi:DNA-binding NtrC family response regulator
MPTRAPLPSPIATSSSAIVALSEDQALLRALMATMLEQAAIVTSSSVDRFIDQLAANNAEVALIDAACAPSPVGAFIQRLRQQFPRLLIVLTGAATLQSELRAQIAAGTIFRFAPKPAAAQRLKIFLNAAFHRSRQEQAALASPAARSSEAMRTEPPAQHSGVEPRTAGWLQRLRWPS